MGTNQGKPKSHSPKPLQDEGLATGKQSNYQGKKPFWKKEEQLLRLSRSIEFAPISVVITDLEGKIEYVNSFFSALTGLQLLPFE